jgi:hypothetical protein
MNVSDARGDGGDMAPLPRALTKASAVKGNALNTFLAKGRYHLSKPTGVAFYPMEKNYQVLAGKRACATGKKWQSIRQKTGALRHGFPM